MKTIDVARVAQHQQQQQQQPSWSLNMTTFAMVLETTVVANLLLRSLQLSNLVHDLILGRAKKTHVIIANLLAYHPTTLHYKINSPNR
eukprot:6473082-Amphidinium_carterae.1